MNPHTIPGTIRTEDGVHLFHRDWGDGAPVLFVGGWSLPSDAWNYQMLALSERALRCVAYDRRGHGRSSDPGRGYDFDTLAADLAAVIDTIDLREVTLVGHSMGCNEIVRYLSLYGSERVARIALLGTVTPMVRHSADNPNGIPAEMFALLRQQLRSDFPRWIDENLAPFLTPETSPGMGRWFRQLALGSSLQALLECNRSLVAADFRPELRRVDVPTLIIAGDRDVSAPLELTAVPTAELIAGSRLKVYAGAPHGMFVTHMEQVNRDLLEFIGVSR